jgi:HEAT repeat protein
VERVKTPEAITAVTTLIAAKPDWPVRVRAVAALGAIAQGTADPKAAKVLEAVALTDPYSLVREEAVAGIHGLASPASAAVLKTVSEQDPEPRVRKLAQSLLKKRP